MDSLASYLCRVLLARAPVLGLCFIVSVNTDSMCRGLPGFTRYRRGRARASERGGGGGGAHNQQRGSL